MIEEAFKDFFMVTLPMPFRLRHVNVFLLIHGDEIALFDTGMNTQETFLILEKALQTIRGQDGLNASVCPDRAKACVSDLSRHFRQRVT